jgi:hypothetical protein
LGERGASGLGRVDEQLMHGVEQRGTHIILDRLGLAIIM